MDFGQLSFRQGRSQVVGLPLDVIDKVGTQLTERYHRNRSAASKVREQVLSMPDSNSEQNRKIIEGISNEVSAVFSEYAKDGSWSQADDAVYDVADKLASNQDVKALYKYAGQYAKVEEEIDKSEASEVYKQARRAKNQMLNKGIKDEQGNYVGYQGRALPKNLDVTADYKKYDDLMKGWEADMQSYTTNPSTFNMENASDGFKQTIMKYGTQKITQVDKAEVAGYLMDLVSQDAEFRAKVETIAELDHFRTTGKLAMDREDVMSAINQKAATNPNIQMMMVYSSDSFIKQTDKMNDVDKAKFANKILSNKDLRAQYYTEGIANYMNKVDKSAAEYPTAYEQAYKGMYVSDAMQGVMRIADKYSYTRVDSDMKYMFDPLDGKRYEDYLKNQGAHTMVTTDGQMNVEGIETFIQSRDGVLKDISMLKAQLESPNLSEDQRKQKKEMLNRLEGDLRAKDLIIDSFKQSIGFTEQGVFEQFSPDLEAGIMGLTATYVQPVTSFGKFTPKLPNGYPKAIHEIMKTSASKSSFDIQKELQEKNINVDVEFVDKLKGLYTDRLNRATQQIFEERGMESVSIPIIGIGNFGEGSLAYQQTMGTIAEKFALYDGSFDILVAPNTDEGKEMIGGTNMGSQKTWTHPTKKVGARFPVRAKLATIKNDSPYNTGQLMVQIEETNPETGEVQTYLARYKGNDIVGDQMLNDVFNNALKSATKPNNPFAQTDVESLRYTSGIMGGNTPVTGVDGKTIQGMTMSGAATNIKSISNTPIYEDMNFNIYGNDYVVKTVRQDNGKFTQHLLTADGHRVLDPIADAITPNAINQYIGAIKKLYEVGPNSPAGDNIKRIFNLKLSE